MPGFIKNIPSKKALKLSSEVHADVGQIVSKTLIQNKNHNLTLFAFSAGEEISTHTSEGDAFIQVLEGRLQLTISGEVFVAQEGEVIVMPATEPHAVLALEASKFLLTVFFN